MIAALSEPVMLALIIALPPFIMSLLAFLKTRKVESDVQVVHTLVNSPHGIALESLALALEDRAKSSKKPADIKRAERARKDSDDHKAQQATVDAHK